jgi:hypothetical protein
LGEKELRKSIMIFLIIPDHSLMIHHQKYDQTCARTGM